MNPSSRPAPRRSQSGVMIIEVLVAIVILAFGMLAYANLQAVALAHGKMATYRSAATQLAADYADRMRANAAVALAGGYAYVTPYAAGPVPVPLCVVPGNCTAAEIAAMDLALWRNNANLTLPGGSLFAQMDPALPPPPASLVAAMDLWIIWRDPTMADANEAGENCPAAVLGAGAGLSCLYFRVTL